MSNFRKSAVKGTGWSSPVVFDKQIWLTSATGKGTEYYAMCYDFESGSLLYEQTLFHSDNPQRIHSSNSYATPTPCIEEGYVYVIMALLGQLVSIPANLKCMEA